MSTLVAHQDLRFGPRPALSIGYSVYQEASIDCLLIIFTTRVNTYPVIIYLINQKKDLCLLLLEIAYYLRFKITQRLYLKNKE
jgi:hypothetical protein